MYSQQLKVIDNENVMALARWEQSTTATIKRRQIELRAKQLSDEAEDDLEDRRRKLKSLYKEEMEGWKYALANQAETLDERKER